MPTEQEELASRLAGVGRAVRDAVLATPASHTDGVIVRHAGGDDVYGLDERADHTLRHQIGTLAARWPGQLVMEGFDQPLPVGEGSPWTYLADPVDGTRPWLAGKRSAWILLGAGRQATTLEDLEVGAAVELPTPRARYSLVTWATRGGPVHAQDDDLTGAQSPTPVALHPRADGSLHHRFVTLARVGPGTKQRAGALEDRLLAGLEVYEDPYLSTGGQLIGLAQGGDAAVLDARPLLGIPAAHPYDLAALVVARAAGVVVEALPPGPLTVPLDVTTDVAWAGYANPAIAAELRTRWARHQP